MQATVMGHVAWTCQNASGNHGDDLCALNQCDLQPYKILHLNMEMVIPTILGLQDEHKAIKNGMQTVSSTVEPKDVLNVNNLQTVNPTYTAFIALQSRNVSFGCNCHLSSLAAWLLQTH